MCRNPAIIVNDKETNSSIFDTVLGNLEEHVYKHTECMVRSLSCTHYQLYTDHKTMGTSHVSQIPYTVYRMTSLCFRVLGKEVSKSFEIIKNYIYIIVYIIIISKFSQETCKNCKCILTHVLYKASSIHA